LASVHPDAELGDGCAIGPFAVVEAGAELGPGCVVGPGSVVGAGAVLGAGCVLHARVVLYPRVELGERVRVHAGAVLGSPGFGSVRVPDGWLDFPQVGGLSIGDDVVVGANTCIDGGALEPTVIESQVRLDNLVQLAHGVRVGQRTAIAAQTGVGGSSSIGEDVLLAGQVGIADHVTIESGAALGGKTGVPSGVRLSTGQWLGLPAMPMALASKVWAATRRLPSLRKRIAALEAEED
jgi:UDP-3-O-[3-hydroxymyristoyl] glucosamine N-acyltransferase